MENRQTNGTNSSAATPRPYSRLEDDTNAVKASESALNATSINGTAKTPQAWSPSCK